jgi:hypothetical protein
MVNASAEPLLADLEVDPIEAIERANAQQPDQDGGAPDLQLLMELEQTPSELAELELLNDEFAMF